MDQVISNYLSFLDVDVQRDEERSLISHEQGPRCCISIYPDNDAVWQPRLGDAIAILDENPVVHMPCSESGFYLDAQHADEGNSSILFLDKQNDTTCIGEMEEVGIGEHDPTEEKKQGRGSEPVTMTEVDFANDSYIEGAVISQKIMLGERRIGPYTSSQKILLVGEGDFSFSASLAEAFTSATNMVATSLDSHEFLSKNYKHSVLNISKLTGRGGVVLHCVDCTKMEDMFSSMSFDRIIYNFPHAGCFGRDEFHLQQHQTLVRLFLANAKKLMQEGGEIHITHKSSGFFRQWDIKTLALDEGLLLLEEVPFKHKHYPGYRTMCGFRGNNFFHCYPSKTYKFGHPQAF